MSDPIIHHEHRAGDEAAVVLIHGMACDGSDWAAQVEHFSAAARRVVTVDLRGHGQSMNFSGGYDMPTMGGDVAALLRHLGIGAAIVAGHSMGCRVATEAALQAPDIVRGVALIDGSRFANGDPEAAVAARRALIERDGFAAHMQANFDAMFLPGTDAAVRQRIVARARARPADIGTEVMLSMVHWDAALFEQRYRALKVPVQVVQSTHMGADRTRQPVTADTVVGWHAELSGCGVDAEFECVPDCGHFTMLDTPEVVNRSLERLLARI